MATSGSSFTPTHLGHEDNLEINVQNTQQTVFTVEYHTVINTETKAADEYRTSAERLTANSTGTRTRSPSGVYGSKIPGSNSDFAVTPANPNRDLESTVDLRVQSRVCPPRTVLQRPQSAPGVVLVQNPRVVALQILAFLPHCFSKLSQDLNIVLMFHRLAFRYPFDRDDAINIEQKRGA
ncbi:hypothetical protein TNCV_4835601 [Trichonephila clavipes]|nr:hypothetical protein TNCV_4835601 [Trichonephila clavipes]